MTKQKNNSLGFMYGFFFSVFFGTFFLGQTVFGFAVDVTTSVTYGCGNGVKEAGEECEGNDFGGKNCFNRGFNGGTLQCINCRIDTSNCEVAPGQGAPAAPPQPPDPVCGNEIVEFGEVCDDGNDIETDACLSTCVAAACGDGFIQEGVEVCDDGNDIETDACLSTCVAAACGDGFIQEGVEACDDGNIANNDGCSNICEEEAPAVNCGNQEIDEGEECDDGNILPGDGCDIACIVEVCGNGVVQAGEDCDDANQDNTDACLNNCTAAFCGDGIVHAEVEACDDGNIEDGDACNAECEIPEVAICGNGIQEAEEACDDGNQNNGDVCTNLCSVAVCGDGLVHENVEACDDGNQNNEDVCTNQCVIAVCGDGIVRAETEECDDGNNINNDGCSAQCTNEVEPVCGDGILQFLEECDDGNNDDTDNCTNNCAFAICGDTIIRAGVEQCDDGNNDDTDVCTNQCLVAICGDGSVHVGVEQCDDGNVQDNDGCSAQCVNEVQPACGDGIVQPPEECDSNLFGGNSCITKGFVGGDLLCDAVCRIKTDNCLPRVLREQDPENPIIALEEPLEEPEIPRIGLGNIIITIGNGKIRAGTQERRITTLVGDTITFAAENKLFEDFDITRITIVGNGQAKELRFRADKNRYLITHTVDRVGETPLQMIVEYGDGESIPTPFAVIGEMRGSISDENGNGIVGATITLIDEKTDNEWNGQLYNQQNPAATQAPNGTYGFIVPNGKYIMRIEKEGFHTKETFTLRITDNIVQQSFTLVALLPPLQEDIAEILAQDIPAVAKIGQVAEVITKKLGENTKLAAQAVVETAQLIDEIADDPLVEEITEEVVVPAGGSAVTVVMAPSLWNIILPLTRFLFLQPLLLLSRRKKREWGMVYNSLTKLPIDLAVVRIIDAKTKKVKQSRVTDGKGRFLFIAEPGSYILEIAKSGFSFPSTILQNTKQDGAFAEVYHGEPIVVTEEGVGVTPNIPLDPAGAEKTPKRIIWEKRMRIVQHGFSLSGVFFTSISVYVTPTPTVFAFLGLHILLYFGFVHFVKPKKPKGWGIIYDTNSKEPLSQAVVRLFTKEYNKLVSTFVTDRKGRYAFLVGPSTYFLTMQKKGYTNESIDPIVVKAKKGEEGIIKTDAALQKENGNNASTKPAEAPEKLPVVPTEGELKIEEELPQEKK